MATIESAQTGLWSTPSTWVGGIVPGISGQGYRALIKAGHTVTLDQDIYIGDDRSANALEIESGATLDTDAGHPEYWLWTMGRVQVDGLLYATILINVADYILAITFPPTATLRVELRNRDGALVHVLHQIIDMSWSYLRVGGCDEARIVVRQPFGAIDPLSILDYDCQIVIDDEGAGKAVWWRGSVTDAGRVMGDSNAFAIDALGLVRYLDAVAVVGLGFDMDQGAIYFDDMDATDIATTLLEKVSAWSGLTWDGVSAPSSGVVLEHIEFNGSIFNALVELAKIANDSEFAVDRNGVFHFQPKSVDATWLLIPGKDIAAGFNDSATIRSMVNRLYIIGQDNFMVEDGAGLTADQSQLTTNAWLPFGQLTTGYEEALQQFVTTNGTLSEIDIKLREVGFTTTNKATDGDMEAAGVTNWPTLKARTVRVKGPIRHNESGALGLEIRHNESGAGAYGVYQNMTVSAGVEYRINAWMTSPVWESGSTIEVIDGTAATLGSGTVLATQTFTQGFSWREATFSVTPTTTTLGIRFWADNQVGGSGKDPFFIDDVLVRAVADVALDLIEWDPSADTQLSGTTTVNASPTVVGVGTAFLSQLVVGDRIAVSSAAGTYRTVLTITDNLNLTVDGNLGNGSTQDIFRKTVRVKSVLATAIIPFDSIASAPSNVVTATISAYLSTTATYGFRVRRLGVKSDTQYFEIGYNTAGGYGTGAFWRWDATDWQEVSAGAADAYFETRLPSSILNYRLRSTVVSNPSIFGSNEAQLFGNSMLASLGAPLRRASVPLSTNWRAMIEFAGPPMGTVQVHGLMAAALRPERINYRYDSSGVRVDLELGQILPTDADLLRRIEYQLSRLDKP